MSPASSTIRLSYRQFGAAAADVRAWVAAKVEPGPGGPRLSYDSITRDAIFRLHRGDTVGAALTYLRRRLDQAARLKSIARKDEAEYRLVAYARWLEQEQPIVADVRVRLAYPLGHGVVLGGEIPRIDFDPDHDRYRAVLLGAEPEDWPQATRFALLQRAVARLLGRAESLVAVAVQNLDGSNLRAATFRPADLQRAESEAEALAMEIARVYRKLTP